MRVKYASIAGLFDKKLESLTTLRNRFKFERLADFSAPSLRCRDESVAALTAMFRAWRALHFIEGVSTLDLAPL